MDRTYDPIVAGPEPLTYLQLRSPASPRLGIAMVLVSAKGELMTVRSGSPVPPVRLGRYRSLYHIDTAEHQLLLEAQLPSSDPGFVFQARLTYSCQVIDPAAIAMRQIRDIAALVRPDLISAMRAAASRLDIADSPRAEEAIENALHGVSCDPTVQVSGFSVELPVTADEAAAGGRTFRETHRTTRMTKMKVDRTREMLAGGNPDVLAMHLGNHPEDTGPIIEMMVAGDIAEAQNMLNAISIMYGRSGTEDEPFETRDERKMLMDRFLARALPTGGMRVSGMASADERGSRLRGSLLRSAEEPARKAIKGAVIDDEEEGADTAGAGRPRHRVERTSSDTGPDERSRDDGFPPRPSRIVRSRPVRHDPDSDEDA